MTDGSSGVWSVNTRRVCDVLLKYAFCFYCLFNATWWLGDQWQKSLLFSLLNLALCKKVPESSQIRLKVTLKADYLFPKHSWVQGRTIQIRLTRRRLRVRACGHGWLCACSRACMHPRQRQMNTMKFEISIYFKHILPQCLGLSPLWQLVFALFVCLIVLQTMTVTFIYSFLLPCLSVLILIFLIFFP